MIEINKLRKGYGERILIDNFSYLFTNKLYQIKGPSGCGKTTLLNILLGLDTKFQGNIKIMGTDIRTIPRDWLLRSIYAYIPQEFELIESLTVFENLTLFANFQTKDDVSKKVNYYLNIFTLEKKKDVKIYNLSGGEKKRVSIIRALLKDSKILIADEPFAGLDQQYQGITYKIFKEISKEKPVIIVNHDDIVGDSYYDEIIDFANLPYKEINNSYNDDDLLTNKNLSFDQGFNFKLIASNMKRFLFSNLLILFILLLGFGISILALTYSNIDESKITSEEMKKTPYDSFLLRMGNSYDSYIYIKNKYPNIAEAFISDGFKDSFNYAKAVIIKNTDDILKENEIIVTDYFVNELVSSNKLEKKENYSDYINEEVIVYVRDQYFKAFKIKEIRITNFNDVKKEINHNIEKIMWQHNSFSFAVLEVSPNDFNDLLYYNGEIDGNKYFNIRQYGSPIYLVENDMLKDNEILADPALNLTSFNYKTDKRYTITGDSFISNTIEVSPDKYKEIIYLSKNQSFLLYENQLYSFLSLESDYNINNWLNSLIVTALYNRLFVYTYTKYLAFIVMTIIILLLIFNPSIGVKRIKKNIRSLRNQGASTRFIYKNYFFIDYIFYLLIYIIALIINVYINNKLNYNANLIFDSYTYIKICYFNYIKIFLLATVFVMVMFIIHVITLRNAVKK